MLMNSNSEVFIHFPIAVRYIVLVQILLGVVPSNSVDAVINLEYHGGERTHSGEITSFLNGFIVGVEDKGSIGSVLLVKASEDQDRRGPYLVAHS